jgi:hypothetical protein
MASDHFSRGSNLFTTHPHAVGESYVRHFGVALSYSGRMFAAAFCALVHAVLPFMFEKTASGMLRKMVADMDSRMANPHAAKPASPMQPAE